MKLLFITHLNTLSRTFNCIYRRRSIIGKAYYCDKKEIVIETLEKGKKDKKTTPVSEGNSCKETEKFENEEQILQTVMLEKEKDANIRSRLSKECNKLSDKKIRLCSTGLNLHLEQDTTKNTCWEDYRFDKTIDNLKKHTLAPVMEVKALSESTKNKLSSSSSDGHTSSANRIVRREPGKVLFAFIPEEWFKFFIPKTGVSGFGTFIFTFGIFLVSKEYYVLEHNYYNGLGMLCLWWAAIKYVGPHLKNYLDKEIDDYENAWQKSRNETKDILDEQIEDEKLMQFQAEGQLMLIEAKRENVRLQLEEEFRLRQMTVYREVLKRLNYHVVVADVYKRIFHKNLVEYVTKEVKKSITPEIEKQMLNVSIENLITELENSDKKR